jgi:hypothetical protein
MCDIICICELTEKEHKHEYEVINVDNKSGIDLK